MAYGPPYALGLTPYAFLTPPTLHHRSHPFRAARFGDDPLSHLPGWVVAHVLGMATVQFGYPAPLGILMKARDAALRHR